MKFCNGGSQDFTKNTVKYW